MREREREDGPSGWYEVVEYTAVDRAWVLETGSSAVETGGHCHSLTQTRHCTERTGPAQPKWANEAPETSRRVSPWLKQELVGTMGFRA